MRADEAVKKQLETRLRRLRRRAAETAAEIAMVERLMADVEKQSINPKMRLRKNSVIKLSIQGSIRRLLAEADAPLRAKYLLEVLLQTEPNLRTSTFRSHLRRMVAENIITSSSGRGLYRLVDQPIFDSGEKNYPSRKPVRIEYSYE